MILFVEGAHSPDVTIRDSALKALSLQLGLFRDRRGKFTAEQQAKLLEAAQQYIRDPANQVDLTRPTVVRKNRTA